MATNRDLLKEAIADAKTVKETAIANAKAALEESFGPFLREKLAAKLEEIEVAEDLEETEFQKEAKATEKLMDEDEDGGSMEEEISLDELLAEISEEDTLEEAKKDESEKKSEKKEKTDEAKKAEEEEVSIEDMTEDDLKSFIEGVIKDMVAAGELEAAEGGEGEEMKMDMDMEMPEEGESEEEDTEVNIDELLAELEEGTDEDMVYEDNMNDSELEEAKKKKKEEEEKTKAELEEAYAAIETLRSELQEINLLNAKLLYTNKLFRNKSLSESQKVKVLAAFDKAKNKQEAQLIYETLLGSVATVAKSSIKESLGSASKALGNATKPIIENDAFARMRELAGLTKK